MGEDSMELKERIALLAGAAGACSEGLQELAATKSRVDMLRCFLIILSFVFQDILHQVHFFALILEI